jgi:hypothetical protein
MNAPQRQPCAGYKEQELSLGYLLAHLCWYQVVYCDQHTPPALEQVLTRARLPVIREHLQPKTLIYTHYVQGIDRLLRDALVEEGWKVGFYGLSFDDSSVQEFEVTPPPWDSLAPLCEKYLNDHRFRAVYQNPIIDGDVGCVDMYLDDKLIEMRATTGKGQADVCAALVAAFSELQNYPIELAHMVNKRWDIELGKALKGAGFKL